MAKVDALGQELWPEREFSVPDFSFNERRRLTVKWHSGEHGMRIQHWSAVPAGLLFDFVRRAMREDW